ncbi:unnamed protein product, partial [Rotaria socialis]
MTNSHGTNDHFYGTKDIVTAQIMDGRITWPRETVRSGDR